MKDKLFQLLGVEHNERSLVSILLVQSVFIGVFYGAFDISAHSLFLAIFDEKIMARAYVVSGFSGIILTGLYTWLQARMQFRNFATLNFISVSLITLLLWFILFIAPSKAVVFFVFVLMGPLNILSMLCFWGTTGRLFTLRQGKRLFGLIDAGIIIGVILSSYMIPVILSLNVETHNLILISSLSVLAAGLLQVSIGKKYEFATVEKIKAENKKPALSIFKTNSYIRTIAIFVALSVITAFFVQYLFMAVTREQYPVEQDMARFLGFFTGSMMIFTLLVKVLVFSYLIKNYGLRTCLAISPFLIAGFTAIAIAIGVTKGYTPATGGFIFFFLILTLSRLFSKSLKDSIESPSFKVIYQTIDEKVRYEVQSGIDGTINEMAALSSGLLLSGLGALAFIKLIHFSWVLFAIIILWAFFALRLYTEYRNSIKKALLNTNSDEKSDLEHNDTAQTGKFFSEWAFKTKYFQYVSRKIPVTEQFENKWINIQIIDYAINNKDVNLLPALKRISGDISCADAIRRRAADVITQLENNREPLINAGSENKMNTGQKMKYARSILAGTTQPQSSEILRMLRDNSIDSKRYALFIIGKFRLAGLIPEVCTCLKIEGLEEDTSKVLENFGDEAVEELLRFYLSISGNIDTSIIVLRILGKLCKGKNHSFLFSRLWSNSRRIKKASIAALMNCGFRASGEDRDKLHQLVSDVAGIITWNIAAQICLAQNKDQTLLSTIKKDTDDWLTFLFNLLSIAYDSASISKIRENLSGGTVESVNYALEMIDIVIDESIKPKIVSLVDVVPDEEKLKNLHQFFPGAIPEYNELIDSLLNRDYNQIGIWAKANALRSLKDASAGYEADTIIALLFSQELILREEATRLLAATAPDMYFSASTRLKGESKRYLDQIVSNQVKEPEFIFEKVFFLSSCFPFINTDDLIQLAEELQLTQDTDILNTSFSGCIVWSILPDNNEEVPSIICKGSETKISIKNKNLSDHYFYLLSGQTLERFLIKHPDYTSSVFRYVNSFELN